MAKTRTEKSSQNIRKLTTIAIMSAIGVILQFVEVSIPIMPPFIKLDFSDLPELIVAFAYGPLSGVAVCFIRNVIHIAATSSMAVGELSNFILGCFFCVPAGLIYKRNKSKKTAAIGALVGALCMAVICFPLNYFVIYPIYAQIMAGGDMGAIVSAYTAILPSVTSLPKALLIFNVPFTFIKGLIVAAITFLVYKHISPILHNTQPKKELKQENKADEVKSEED